MLSSKRIWRADGSIGPAGRVHPFQNPAGLLSAQRKYGLGPGEMSTILLTKELAARPILLDDYRARKLAKAEDL